MPESHTPPSLSVIAREVHQLASLFGVLGLRWFVIRQSFSTGRASETDMAAMDDTLNQLRDTIRRLSDLTKPTSHSKGTPAQDAIVEGFCEHE